MEEIDILWKIINIKFSCITREIYKITTLHYFDYILESILRFESKWLEFQINKLEED